MCYIFCWLTVLFMHCIQKNEYSSERFIMMDFTAVKKVEMNVVV